MKIDNQMTLGDVDAGYQAFVDKFKPKKTTDDCYTPEPVYKAVLDWVVNEYGIDPNNIVRPFWPGGDYLREEYPEGCTVVDNPPFSIVTKICRDYMAAGVKFFLFAPYLTNFGGDVGGGMPHRNRRADHLRERRGRQHGFSDESGRLSDQIGAGPVSGTGRGEQGRHGAAAGVQLPRQRGDGDQNRRAVPVGRRRPHLASRGDVRQAARQPEGTREGDLRLRLPCQRRSGAESEGRRGEGCGGEGCGV